MPKKPYNHNKKNNKKNSARQPGKRLKPKELRHIDKQEAKRSAVDKQVKDPQAGMRLNKYISNSGICSRRDADIYISSGNVTVNGKVVTEMGYKVQLTDEVKFDGRRINPEKKVYVLLNKPSGFYVTGSLERNNRTVMDLVASASKSRLSPVGKLGTSAKGLLLLSNDGTLLKKLSHSPIHQIFHIELNKVLKVEDLETLRAGISLKDRLVKPKAAEYVENKSNRHIGIEISSGISEVVPKLITKLGYEIVNLDRVSYGGLTKLNLPRGQYRHLTKQEVINLGML